MAAAHHSDVFTALQPLAQPFTAHYQADPVAGLNAIGKHIEAQSLQKQASSDGQPRLRLHGAFNLCPNTWRVQAYLDHFGIPYRPVEVDILNHENRQPAFLKLNPQGFVPVLEDVQVGGCASGCDCGCCNKKDNDSNKCVCDKCDCNECDCKGCECCKEKCCKDKSCNKDNKCDKNKCGKDDMCCNKKCECDKCDCEVCDCSKCECCKANCCKDECCNKDNKDNNNKCGNKDNKCDCNNCQCGKGALVVIESGALLQYVDTVWGAGRGTPGTPAELAKTYELWYRAVGSVRAFESRYVVHGGDYNPAAAKALLAEYEYLEQQLGQTLINNKGDNGGKESGRLFLASQSQPSIVDFLLLPNIQVSVIAGLDLKAHGLVRLAEWRERMMALPGVANGDVESGWRKAVKDKQGLEWEQRRNAWFEYKDGKRPE